MEQQIIERTRMERANLEVFSETLQHLAEHDRDLLVVTSDSRGSGKLVPFAEKFSSQLIEVGIAEQNLVGVSAGLASTGKKVFAVSPACFLTARSFEQIKNDVAYSDNAVKLIGISAGVSYGALGATHHSLHDYAALRPVNNITIVAPADNFETEMAIRQAAVLDEPVYIRFGKKTMCDLPALDTNFIFGKGRIIRQGNNVIIVATGEVVSIALEAAKLLEISGVEATIVSMHTIKPLDTDLLSALAENGCPIITVEEHSIYGGLGEACASFLYENGYSNRFRILGIPDEYTVTGSQTEILDYYGISPAGIASTVDQLLNADRS